MLLGIIILGIGGGLPRLLGGGNGDASSIGVLTPITPGPTDAATVPTTSAVSQSVSPSSVPPPPVQTKRPAEAVGVVASHVVNRWAHAFYTRTPARETYEELVDRASEFTTVELASSFVTAGDSTYEALRASGGTSKVIAAPVTVPRSDTAPVDTPTRITRLVVITIDTTGKDARRLTVPLLVTVVPEDERWVISAVSGGTGP